MEPILGNSGLQIHLGRAYSKARVKVLEELARRDRVGRRELPDNKASAPLSHLFGSREPSTAAGQAQWLLVG